MIDATDRQQEILRLVAKSIVDRGYPPTLREIGKSVGIRSTNGVNDHIRALERKGYVSRPEEMISRGIRILEKGWALVGLQPERRVMVRPIADVERQVLDAAVAWVTAIESNPGASYVVEEESLLEAATTLANMRVGLNHLDGQAAVEAATQA